MIKDNETLMPQIASPASRPAQRVPILIEITEEDRQNAGQYIDNHNCLVCTTLKRLGYKSPHATSKYVCLNNSDDRYFGGDDLGVVNLCEMPAFKPPFYSSEVVGKQIILYPV